MRLALALAALVVASPVVADTLPHFANGTPYKAVRTKLMAMGYKPFKTSDADTCTAGEASCFPEIESCSSSMSQPCLYTWKKGSAVVEVSTLNDPPKFATISTKTANE